MHNAVGRVALRCPLENMRSILPIAVALLPACTLAPVYTAGRSAAAAPGPGALRASPAPAVRERPRNHLDLMLGGSYWNDLGSLDPTGVGPVPGRFDDFDRWGFAFDMGYDRVVERAERADWTLGLELGFVSWHNDGTGLTTPFSDITADMVYFAPTTRVMMQLSPWVTLSPGIGAGYYGLRIEEYEHYYYGWWSATDSRSLNRDGTFGGFASLALDFHASPVSAIRLENKLHFVRFDGLEALYPNETSVEGPIWTLELGLVVRF